MKLKILYYLILTFILYLICMQPIFAGTTDTLDVKDDSTTLVEEKPCADNAIYLEAGGNGIFVTANYERMISNDFGIRIGYGRFFSVGATVPLMFNLFSGNRNQYEFGVGVVYLPIWSTDILVGEQKSFAFSYTIGLRAQSPIGGFLFRVGFTPLYFLKNKEFIFFGGLSLGSTF